MNAVVVLNATYEPLHTVSVQHAIRMLVREVAVVEEADASRNIGPFPVPLVLRLVRYVKTTWRHRRPPRWTKERILRRDGHICAYCGQPGARTIDHVIPLCKGGRSTFENTVAACAPCNSRKGGRLLADTSMRLRIEPTIPNWWTLHAP